MPSLWDMAFDALSDKDKKELSFARGEAHPKASEMVQAVEDKKKECEKKQWTLYTNKAGEKVLVRDVLSKVCDWLERFKQVGDMAVQFDPAHAAIP